MANGERQQEPFSNRVVWIGLGVRVLVYKCGGISSGSTRVCDGWLDWLLAQSEHWN